MQRPHRTVHRVVWILVVAVAATAFVVSIRVRPEYPVVREVE